MLDLLQFNAVFITKLILGLISFTFPFIAIYYCFIYDHLLHCHLLPFITNHLNGNKWIYHLLPRATCRWKFNETLNCDNGINGQ